MGAISNAVALMGDPELLSKAKAVSVYQARQAVVEATTVASHTQRLWFAKVVIYDPAAHAPKIRDIIACDTAVCGPYSAAKDIPDQLLLDKLAEIWTPLSLMMYNPTAP